MKSEGILAVEFTENDRQQGVAATVARGRGRRAAIGSACPRASSGLPKHRPSSSSRERSRTPPDPLELEGEEREEPLPSLVGGESRRHRIHNGRALRGGQSRSGGRGWERDGKEGQSRREWATDAMERERVREC